MPSISSTAGNFVAALGLVSSFAMVDDDASRFLREGWMQLSLLARKLETPGKQAHCFMLSIAPIPVSEVDRAF